MLTAVDVVTRGARDGVVFSHGLVSEALAQVDRAGLESAERARYELVGWDGSDPCPVGGDADRWLHGKDANSQHAAEAFRTGGAVYFVLRDGQLLYWQPFSPHTGRVTGRFLSTDETHQDHWRKAAEKHLDLIVEQEVDGQHLRAVMDAALTLHEKRGVPYHATVTQR